MFEGVHPPLQQTSQLLPVSAFTRQANRTCYLVRLATLVQRRYTSRALLDPEQYFQVDVWCRARCYSINQQKQRARPCLSVHTKRRTESDAARGGARSCPFRSSSGKMERPKVRLGRRRRCSVDDRRREADDGCWYTGTASRVICTLTNAGVRHLYKPFQPYIRASLLNT